MKQDPTNDRWTAEQIARLIELVHVERLSKPEVAERMGRTAAAIATAVSRYSIGTPGAKRRNCITCRKPFFSSHNGKRICGMCVRVHRLECA